MAAGRLAVSLPCEQILAGQKGESEGDEAPEGSTVRDAWRVRCCASFAMWGLARGAHEPRDGT